MKKRLVHFLQNLRFLFSLTYRVDKRLFLLNLFFFVFERDDHAIARTIANRFESRHAWR